ncbi:MAG: chemotaxis protein CheA [Deltaproteobacteria bacterium]|nr:chemotaxis protein CheA [Deltaproteobacteria bacterium]
MEAATPEPTPPAAEKAAVEAKPEEAQKAEDGEKDDPKKPKKKSTAASKKPKRTETSGGLTESSIRVDVAVLNTLMNLVGELVLARNQIVQFTALHEDIDTNLLAASQRLNLITTEMQEEVMKTRMQPIGNIWSKFPRVVRDLSHTCGKQVRIEMEGVETELDKTLLEAIKDPLTHLVRNSVDHGIEPPEVRVENGKPAEGQLVLRAFHEGGMVNIEISDDGGGIDPQRIKAKALEKQIITNEMSNKMNERELVNLIFQAGFSTAAKVTNVSGRGVGMDVVKTNIEKIGGTVDVSSNLGSGTTFKIKIPLTLAIIPALIVTCKEERYAIPQVSLLELVRLDAGQVAEKIEMLHGAPVYRLRGNLLPLVYLSNELYPGSIDQASVIERNIDIAFNIVVLQADDRQFGLVVDKITDSQEIVVKPLGKQLQGITVFAGATIMGDGHVALILDILGIAQQSNVVSEVHDTTNIEAGKKGNERSSDEQTLLLCQSAGGGRLAIPLSIVARLEEFNHENVEAAGAQEVVQYRGEIMPLIRLSNMLPTSPSAGYMMDEEETEKLQVVVYSHHSRSVGLVVDRIIDIVEDSLEVQRESHHTGVLSSVVIQDRVTDLVDIEGVVRAFDPSFFDQDGESAEGSHHDDSMTMW